MNVQELKLDREKARELYQAYKKHQYWSEPIDDEVRRAYQLIAQGRMVIRALESIRAAGLDKTGLPKLAITRATAERCWVEVWADGRAQFREVRFLGHTETRKRISLPAGTFSSVPPFTQKWQSTHDGSAIVPLVPVHLRPKRGLANYHILWEAEWSPEPPMDPMLVRRIGKGDMWLVVAAWDLTEVERAALATRLNG